MTTRPTTKLAAFILRVQRATAARGKKTELASFLGTSPQGLNDWLSGRRAPGGEVTLLMLEWVQAEEATQQKSRGDVIASPRPKARKLKSQYEKSKRVPKGQ